MELTTPIETPQDIIDRGIGLFAQRKVKRRFRRGLFKVLGSAGHFYLVDIRTLLPGAAFPAPTCSCRAWFYNRATPCKHIVAATYAAMMKGWL